MGQHRVHPVTVIARTTLAELNQAARAVTNPDIPMPPPARTGGDTALPMRDLIRMAADAIHYLAVFDNHTERPIYLGRQARIATADHRLLRPRRRLHPTELCRNWLSLRGPPQPGLDAQRRHRRRQTVLRLLHRPRSSHQGPLPNERQRQRPPRLVRRHQTT